jgi:hypothetical protein
MKPLSTSTVKAFSNVRSLLAPRALPCDCVGDGVDRLQDPPAFVLVRDHHPVLSFELSTSSSASMESSPRPVERE